MNDKKIKLKISRDTIKLLRDSFIDVEERARAMIIIDFLSYADKTFDKIAYPNKKGVLAYIRKRLCTSVNGQKDPAKDILQKLQKLGIIVIVKGHSNRYNKEVWEFSIDDNFQDYSWNTFREDDEEIDFLRTLSKKYLEKSIKRHKDDSIILPEPALEELKQTNQELATIISKRIDGECIPTVTSVGKTGRIYTFYTNLKKSIRNQLMGFDGEKLEEIDLSSSQCSFLIGFLRNLKTLSPEQIKELDALDILQNAYSWHTHFSKILNLQGIKISRDLMKPLIFKFIFSNYDLHDKGFFKNEVKETFKNAGIDINLAWNTLLSHFQETYPNVYILLRNVSNSFRLKGTSLAATLQNIESLWLKNVISSLNRHFKNVYDFQYITLHDSVIVSRKYIRDVKSVLNEVSKKWKNKGYSLNYKKDIERGGEKEEAFIYIFQKSTKKLQESIFNFFKATPEIFKIHLNAPLLN